MLVQPLVFLSRFLSGVERAGTTTVPPLVNFQVQQPPALPSFGTQCTVELVHHLFGNSYYHPAIVQYTPPTTCGDVGKWAGVSLNYTATSKGRQYDRLTAVTLHNVEIWRTSTAEPTKTGIIWTALKDVSRYIPLFSQPGTLILDLNNIVAPNIGLTGEYDVTLTATFYEPSILYPSAKTSSQIIPLTNLSPDQPNYFGVPPSFNIDVTLPTNTAEAYAEIYASGNADEEFWYNNAANKYFRQPAEWHNGFCLHSGGGGASSFCHESQCQKGGHFCRPIAAYGAFDQPTYKVDLTPFVPLLADGQVILSLLTLPPPKTTMVVQDQSSKPTTGKILSYSAPAYATADTTGIIVTGSGKSNLVKWTQDLSFHNFQSYSQDANYQVVQQSATGKSLSTHNGVPVVSDTFSYPLDIVYYNIAYGNTTGWYASVNHSYDRSETPSPLIVGCDISTTQYGAGTYLRTNGEVTANGTTTETFRFADYAGNTYTRSVSATNSSVTADEQGGTLSSSWPLPWAIGGSSSVSSDGGGAHDQFAVRVLDRRILGDISTIW
ncbi:hypothetical protein BS47DRAFT_1399898 [Hydnum rufescens UP504]|uniref:Peptide N-acetyl-beta-D-glucosaminyl asparaginase amidase A N-terminal domain-containing protein n=1 Tax=Hydnum rufescens UP504 TaxID=1448309 RepID=A0A9P6AHU6_9AGAM|nr:hypothetical protein BS47DRAFT_1399898 [Hydnum rufescens UP504]